MDLQATEGRDGALLRPAGDIYEEGDKVTVKLEMPGVAKGNLEISVEGNNLQILGKRSDRDSDASYLFRERLDGDFARAFTFDETVDREGIDAVLEHGILTLTLNRKEAEKPRKIEVQGE